MKELIFYTIASTVIALMAQALHASLTLTIITSLLIPPVILLVVRVTRL
jgi:hypothetical protein